MGLGIAGALALKRASRGGGAAITWVDLLSCDQGSGTAVAPGADASGFRSSGGHNTTTGVTEITCAGSIVAADGYQENVLWYSEDLSVLLPDFDPSTEALAIRILRGDTPSGTVELNLWAGLLDGQPSGTASGCCFFWGHGSGAADNSGLMGATAMTFSGAGGLVDSVTGLIQIMIDGTTRETRVTGRNLMQSGAFSGGANWGAGQNLATEQSSWKICWGLGHRSTDSLAGIVTTGFKVQIAKVPLPDFLA